MPYKFRGNIDIDENLSWFRKKYVGRSKRKFKNKVRKDTKMKMYRGMAAQTLLRKRNLGINTKESK